MLSNTQQVDGRTRSVVTFAEYRRGKRPPNYGQRYPAEVLTRDEIDRLLTAVAGGYLGTRDQALVILLWRCGLRIAEALALEIKDVDWDARALHVLRGKGNVRRVVGLDDRTARALQRWLQMRRAAGLKDAEGPFFCVMNRPTRGKPMYDACVREMLKRGARKAGIARRVHPHGLRHTFASDLAREGVPLVQIQILLGHRDIAHTSVYVHKLAPWEAVSTMQKREWGPVKHQDAHLAEVRL